MFYVKKNILLVFIQLPALFNYQLWLYWLVEKQKPSAVKFCKSANARLRNNSEKGLKLLHTRNLVLPLVQTVVQLCGWLGSHLQSHVRVPHLGSLLRLLCRFELLASFLGCGSSSILVARSDHIQVSSTEVLEWSYRSSLVVKFHSGQQWPFIISDSLKLEG